jgi:hypothetical protein
VLRAELAAALDRARRLELRVAELERRLGMDSSNSGTPTSKEPAGAAERRKAERRQRQAPERERGKDRRRGGQPGHPGTGLSRDLDPGERKSADPPAQCSRCGTALDGARTAGSSWAQVWDVQISRLVTEWLLPMLECPCYGQVITAAAPPGVHAGTIAYGPGVNTAAVLLAAYGKQRLRARRQGRQTPPSRLRILATSAPWPGGAGPAATWTPRQHTASPPSRPSPPPSLASRGCHYPRSRQQPEKQLTGTLSGTPEWTRCSAIGSDLPRAPKVAIHQLKMALIG